jgi:ATP synthase subunit 6
MKVSEFYAILLLEIGALISLLNILGMVPFSLSITSQILFPLFLSLSLFFFNNLIGICCHGFYLFNLFLPSGVPLFITPLLLLIEYISYFARIFSLSIRLCANMLSVHILLKILIGFISVLIFTSI